MLFAQNQFKISGGNVKVSGDVQIVLQDSKWVNNGTFTATNGTVHVNGTASEINSSVEGSNVTNFYNLSINKSVNNAQLGQNASVSNMITLQNGSLDVKNFNLTLDGTYSLNNGEYFITSGTGSLIQEVANGTTKTYPVGNDTYVPLQIQNMGVTDDYSVRTTPEVLDNGITGTTYTTDVVDQTWFVEEGVVGGSDLTLTATWNVSNELAGFNRNLCYMSHFSSGYWDQPTASAALGSNPYSISRSAITTLSPFAIGSNGVLPVELLDFNAIRSNDDVKLLWTTRTEINSDYFEIQHSRFNGGNQEFRFDKIGEIQAAGHSTTELEYNFLHEQPLVGVNYYRLKQFDLDGTFEYSKTVSVLFDELENSIIKIFPNPVKNVLHIITERPTKIRISNVQGQILIATEISNAQELDVSHLTDGIYFITYNSISHKFVIQR